LCKYLNWVYDGSFGVHVRHRERGTRTFAPHMLRPEVMPFHHRVLARLRAGCWPLAVNSGRMQKVPRGERVCGHCRLNLNLQQVEDERHVLLECPKYDPIRARYHDLLDPAARSGWSVKGLLSYASQTRLASFLFAVHKTRFG